ncbi:hypothetical protein V3O24_05370 [Methylobacter sp. Wu8]|uniref:Uncharacterized protein n=1 Tax=Methylobacter tundripaludum TaxID=173365 RepID=A0A2S6GEL9_9GAMM|nr:hypothetical protein [Methylobacter tundripaludum]MCK9636866.1 hypothetical protein [Methylobacter tundripaludum]PPK63662.1 hypothetical protein B0F88_1329 [Methylobacter tundripaludum]
MNIRFSNEIITSILQQSLVYTCSCPAQVCKAINEQRALFNYQKQCLNLTDTDKAVHQAIADTVEKTHAQLEQCLEDVLRLEGWDMDTYQMPETMQKRLISEFEDSLK